ncbi:type I-C CRISPR-associated endonuclease Cas1c [Christensenellaceae bacterium OttesenSCG-928-M15]|nr:type I-C CRISPR-associated endonuclease Cas1c [Christensenellaceae bacterium OttesenSCG-928-M15]
MRKLLNTLYVTTPEAYLALNGENVVVQKEGAELLRIPLHNLEGIVTFGYTGASPGLMGACAKRNISLCFMSANGRFLARTVGEVQGNVLLRRQQYRIADDEAASCAIARHMIVGKLFNARWILERATRDHPMRVDMEKLHGASGQLQQALEDARNCFDLEQLRGFEGKGAHAYFNALDELILQQKEEFYFVSRNRRPPLDRFNALLSFLYTLLANDTAAALSTVGLDPYVGFLHRDRPGRVSLALDVMEELRPILADRLALSLINRREIHGDGFTVRENGAVIMDDDTRKAVLSAWQARKREVLTHPFLNEKMPWGLVPFVQAMLLARHIRGDLEAYPPFLWK